MSVANFLGKRERLKNLRAKRRQKKLTEAPTPKLETPFEFMARMETFRKGQLEPYHLKRLADAFERMAEEELRVTVSIPPRHGKSQSLIHFVVWWMIRNPTKTAIVISHTASLAKKLSRMTRDLATKAGIKLRKDSNSLSEWTTTSGGGCIFTSVGGPITGQGADLLIIDDPHKDRAEAESALCRENVWEWYQGTAYTRVEPGGSVILCHTRWHPEDLIGMAHSEHESANWEDITLPAIDDEGKPLWPERHSLMRLEDIKDKVGRYNWDSQYQGRPVARGGAIFGGTWMYDPSKLPEGLRIRIGIDLAYSAKTKSDYSALVVTGQSREGGTYIIHVARAQIEVPQFAALIKAQIAMYPGCTVHWHTSTTEQGIAQMLRSQGVNIMHQIAKNDKFIRAQPVAAAWNAGRVLIPGVVGQAKPVWLDAFVGEVCGFTGVGDKHDDMVDAMASAFDVGAAIGHPEMPRAFAHQFNTGTVGPHGAAALKPLKFRIFQEW